METKGTYLNPQPDPKRLSTVYLTLSQAEYLQRTYPRLNLQKAILQCIEDAIAEMEGMDSYETLE